MHPSPTTRGFTLLELMIGVMIMSLVLFTTAQSLRTGSAVSKDTLDNALAAADAGRILHGIAVELRSADKNFVYETTSTGGVVVFSYSTCTGFDLDTGVPLYDPSGKVSLVYNPNDGTLKKYTIGGLDDDDNKTVSDAEVADDSDEDGILLSDMVALDGFSVQQIGTVNTGTVYGNRIRLNLTLVRNAGQEDEVVSSASRVVFLRSYLFNSDGIDGSGSNTGTNNSGGATGGQNPPPEEDPTVNWEKEHPATDETPDTIPNDSTNGTHPPKLYWSTDQSTSTEAYVDSAGDSHEVHIAAIRVTVEGPKITYTQGNGNNTKTAQASLKVSDITVNLPYHEESQYQISFKVPGNGNQENAVSPTSETTANKVYIDIIGPKIGSFPITIGSKTRGQTVDGQTFEASEILDTNTY